MTNIAHIHQPYEAFLQRGIEKAQELLDDPDMRAFVLITIDKDGLPSYHYSQTGNRKLALFGAVQVILTKLIYAGYIGED